MGIHGLLKKLNSSLDDSVLPKENITRGSTLIIDGNGLLFHLCSTVLTELHKYKADRQFGGNYSDFESLIVDELVRLTKTLGFKLIVYFDGDNSYLKGDTSEKRRKQILEQWNALQIASESSNNNSAIIQDNLPLPPMAKDQLLATLKALKIECRTSAQEADQDIALECFKLNSVKPNSCYCFSGDSDFIAMRDCAFIHFNSLIFHHNDGTALLNDSKSEVLVRVWRRAHVAEALGLTEGQFVELCLLMGNDFTLPFDRKELHYVNKQDSGTPVLFTFDGQRRDAVIDDLITLIRDTHDPHFRVSSRRNDAAIETALQYSRAMYELSDLTPFYIPANLTPKDQFRDSSENHTQLRSSQRAAIEEWLQCEEENLFAQLATVGDSKHSKLSTLDISAVVLSFLSEIVANKDCSTAVADSSANSDLVQIDSAFNEFNETNVAAFTLMLEYVRDNKRVDRSSSPRLKWANVLLANTYQLVLRELKKRIAAMFPERIITFDPPCALFDGRTFHNIMEFLEEEMADDVDEQEDLQETPAAAAAKRADGSAALPIDAYQKEILAKVKRDRVVIIHGETGCGKSTRIPAMLLEEAQRTGKKCKMMVSQPRRIAAASLMKRLRNTSLGAKVGMRMGHGVRDESDETQVYFVTTGYLVRLMASNPKIFRRHTHLVIDEVHERSVDGDVLCLLARKLLTIHPTLRIILMSATVHTDLYRSYFSEEGYDYGDLDCLSVGLRRFPLTIRYVEDLIKAANAGGRNSSGMSKKVVSSNGEALLEMCGRCSGRVTDSIPAAFVKNQYNLAEAIIKSECATGTGVLVFVSGIADITEMQGRFEGISKYKVFAIHSDIPYEEQEGAFLPVESHEIKVVIATNAAESSITLPDVDVVICLGTHKATAYQGNSQRVQLINTWVSKASATQRAGRTGRVRPGAVYRLYSKELHDKFQEHEQAEVHRQPLHDTILSLRAMLEGTEVFTGMIPILNDLLEPPDLCKVEDSFQFLYKANMISKPSDEGMLTYTGLFAGQLPVDLQLSRLIVYGISLGIGAEAVVLASALAQPKSVFRLASLLIHKDPDEYNEIMRQTFLGSEAMDNGVLSQPIMMLRLFLLYRRLDFQDANDLASALGLAHSRVRQFVSSTKHLLQKVNDSLHTTFKKFNFDSINPFFSETKLTLLRLILTWTNEANIIRYKPNRKVTERDLFTVEVASPMLTDYQLKSIFPKPIHYKLENRGRRIYDGALSDTRLTAQCNVLELLIDVFRSAGDHPSIALSWVVVEGSEGRVQPGENNYNTGNSYIVFGLIDCSAEYSGKEHSTAAIEHAHALANARALLLGTFNQRLIYNGESHFYNKPHSTDKADLVKRRLDTFFLVGPSKRDLKESKDFHDFLPAAASMLLPVRGHAKLTVSNYVPSKAHLYNMFFKTGLSVDEVARLDTLISSAAATATEGDAGIAAHHGGGHHRYKIAEQVTSAHQTIVFTHPLDRTAEDKHDEGEAGEAIAVHRRDAYGLVPELKAWMASISAEKEGKKYRDSYRPLIDNIPLGLRLYIAYCSAYKTKKLLLWKDEPGDSTADGVASAGKDKASSSSGGGTSHQQQSTPAKKGLVPGSVKWQALKSGKDSASTSTPDKAMADEDTPGSERRASAASPLRGAYNDRNATESEDPDKVVVTAKVVQPKWEFVRHAAETESEERTSSSTNPYPMAFMGSGSTLSTAIHFGLSNFNANISWYGVSHNTVTVGKAGDLVLCEGVTLLPLGDKWISLALLCIGVENGIKGAVCNTFNPRDVASYISREELDYSSDICNAFSDLKHQPVGVDTNLIALVKGLFRVGVNGHEAEDSSSDEDEDEEEDTASAGGDDVTARINSARREVRRMKKKSGGGGGRGGGGRGNGKGGDSSNSVKKRNGGGGRK